MLTVSHIAQHLSTAPHPPSRVHVDPPNYCIYCGSILAHAGDGAVEMPRMCPLHIGADHEWRQCNDCSRIASAIYYYHGNGVTYLRRSPLTGSMLDLYVWIVRASQEYAWTRVNVPHVAAELGYHTNTIRASLVKLRELGILAKLPSRAHVQSYKPLIWQKPKGD